MSFRLFLSFYHKSTTREITLNFALNSPYCKTRVTRSFFMRKDIYTIIFVDNYKRLSMLNEFFELFNHRMAFSLNSEEVNSFLKLDYNISTQTVRNNKGVYTNLLTSNTKEFKFFKDIEND